MHQKTGRHPQTGFRVLLRVFSHINRESQGDSHIEISKNRDCPPKSFVFLFAFLSLYLLVSPKPLSPRMESLCVAALQLNLKWESPEANRQLIDRMVLQLNSSPDIIVLPEMFTTGFTMNPSQNFEEPDGPTEQWMRNLASRSGALVVGSIIVKDEQHYYNRLLAVNAEETYAEYNKRHLFRLGGEHEHYQPGKEWVVFEYRGWRICPMICYDLRFPVWGRNRLWADGQLAVDLMLYVANWPHTRIAHWKTLLQARAIENQAYVVGVNRVGTDGYNLTYSGDSMMVDFQGNLLTAHSDTETALEFRLESAPLKQYREAFPFWMDADSFDLAI